MCTLMTHLFFHIYVLQLQNRREYGREEIGEEYLPSQLEHIPQLCS